MGREVYLHVGAPKTGTTYLQRILARNRDRLRETGLLYAGSAPRAHFWAAQDLRGFNFKGYHDPNVDGAWQRLVDDIKRWRGPAIVDHELLAAANRKQIDRVFDDLHFADIHIVWTARDLARQLPAAWQERVKNRETLTFHEFLKMVYAALHEKPPHPFWRYHDTPAVLARWSRGLPAENVHLITVPASGAPRELLWQRFASVLGRDPEAYDLDIEHGNKSLGAAEAGVLRYLNEMIADAEVPWPIYATNVKNGVATILAERAGQDIELPPEDFAWAVQWSRDAVRELSSRGYHIVGDLSALIPASRPVGQDPDDLPLDALADAAMAALAAMVENTVRRRTRSADTEHRPNSASGALRRVAARLRLHDH